jgi:hypothetical protein
MMNTLEPRRCLTILVAVLVGCMGLAARADVFNMGGTRDSVTGTWTGLASLEFVTVGDPGNAPDTAIMWATHSTGYGSVAYIYQIGKYDVTLGQYCQFLNAVATVSDTCGLYNSDMTNGGGWFRFGITQNGDPGSYSYSLRAPPAADTTSTTCQ